MWLENSEAVLGEDSWPEEIRLSTEDVLRLIRAMAVSGSFDEGLMEIYS
jgi:hypothetical protein